MDHLFSPNSGSRFSRSQQGTGRSRLIARLIVGLIQGALLYGLYRVTKFDALNTGPLVAWAMIAGFAPPVWLAAIGQVSLRSTLVWGSIATIILGLLGWASGSLENGDSTLLVLGLCLPAALFCAHHLIVPALRQGEAFVPYDHYYETAWKAGIQLVLALMFVGVFWLILMIGGALFRTIGISFVMDVIGKAWFITFLSAIVFALGVELSDVRDGLTQGIRMVALTLLSWLLPVAVLLAGAFLIALPVVGTGGLHTSLSPAAFMLASAAGLIILINTVYQDGAEHLSETPFLRITMRVACVLLVPLTAFALWAVWVRIGQHGLTPQRIVALTGAIIGLLYGIGYVAAQWIGRQRGGGWMPLLEGTNVAVAVVTTLVLLAYSTPWLNPVQLSINNQLARVASGTLSADQIPYAWLGWKGGPRARAALEELSRSPDAEIARRAKNVLDNRFSAPQPARVTFYPEGTPAPENFTDGGVCYQDCPARLLDVTGDGQPEVLMVVFNEAHVFERTETGSWKRMGLFALRHQCGGGTTLADKFISGDPQILPPSAPSALSIDGQTLDFRYEPTCPVNKN